MSSEISLGMGSGLDQNAGAFSDGLQPEGDRALGERFYDTIAYLIYCGTHQKIALATNNMGRERAVWLPFVVMPSGKKWIDSAEEGIRLILNKEDPELAAGMKHKIKIPIGDNKRIEVYRTELPMNKRFITRLTHLVRLEKSNEFKCCENIGSIEWIGLKDAIDGKVQRVWGSEVRQFALLCKEKTPKNQGISESLLELVLDFEKKGSDVEELLKSVNINRKKAEVLYEDFLEHCFPSSDMSLHSFQTYLKKYSLDLSDNLYQMLFNAFDSKRKGFLDFSEILIGLAMIDQGSVHKEARAKFLFRYYDIDCDGYLNESEFKRIIAETSPNESAEALEEKVKESFKSMNATNRRVSLKAFVTALGSLKIRGTSRLCRYSTDIIKEVTKSMSSRSQLRISSFIASGERLTSGRRSKGICGQCRAQKYEYGLHAVLLNTSGRYVLSKPIYNTESADPETNDYNPSNPFHVFSKEMVFNSRFIANVFIDMIREFNRKSIGFLTKETENFVYCLKSFCIKLEEIFLSEERVIRITSPVYIFGDIFGNLNDLLQIESVLWNSFPIVWAKYVFLGNYVDYGKWGLESILYLLSLKLISPNNVFLLRGRHEVRDIQMQNTFQKECIDKYGKKSGQIIWDLINGLFDVMPTALVIDETVFCAHSGIPNIQTKALELKKTKKRIKKPSKDEPIVWQLLTNRPTNQSIDSKTGFSDNSKLGSGYEFSEAAVKHFLKINSFTHIICGNDPTPSGYRFYFGAKFLTVFSSSRFENNNQSAVLLLQNRTIRIIRLDISADPNTAAKESVNAQQKT